MWILKNNNWTYVRDEDVKPVPEKTVKTENVVKASKAPSDEGLAKATKASKAPRNRKVVAKTE